MKKIIYNLKLMNNKLLEKIEKIAGLKLSEIKEEYKLTQLGLDSIKLAEIASILEDELERELTFKEMMEMTPNKLLKLIEQI